MKKYMEESKKGNFEILLEDIQTDVKKVLEATDTHTQQLGRMEGTVEEVQETLAQVKSDVDAVKTTLEQVNLVDLKQEVSDLRKRVEEIESRIVK